MIMEVIIKGGFTQRYRPRWWLRKAARPPPLVGLTNRRYRGQVDLSSMCAYTFLMDSIEKVEKNLTKAGATEDEVRENLFIPLVNDAKSTLRRAMLNSHDEKLAVSVAESILDRAGQGKKREAAEATQVVINDSNVQLLLQAQKEVMEE